jgi:hypothetical protein
VTPEDAAALDASKARVRTQVDATADLDWAIEAQKNGQDLLFNAIHVWSKARRRADHGEPVAAQSLDTAWARYVALSDVRRAAATRLRGIVGHSTAAASGLVTTTTVGPEEHAHLQRIKAERLHLLVRGVSNALEAIRVTVETIETRPELFGSAEALERQMMTLLSVRHLLWGHAPAPNGAFLDARESFIAQVNGEPSAYPLYAILREEGMVEELPRLLGDFARWMAQQYPPKGALEEEAPEPIGALTAAQSVDNYASFVLTQTTPLAEAPPDDAPATTTEASAR